ncbi:hypothetical protein [Serratia fonticola]|uniref:hypothetical protein n=1 Tax=Serratia fonticola TaxID=47917 RepID=UPI000BA1F197|nr:hypothetical protein [Serratia fonticola]PAA95496.1 hypothetical protein CJJ13_21940 [Serratia fonticola]
MNIDKWLAETLLNIKGSDPEDLIRKMEEYGFIEDDPSRLSIGTQFFQVNQSLVSNGVFSVQCDHITTWAESHKELVFTAASPKAAPGSFEKELTSKLPSCNSDWQLSIGQAA